MKAIMDFNNEKKPRIINLTEGMYVAQGLAIHWFLGCYVFAGSALGYYQLEKYLPKGLQYNLNPVISLIVLTIFQHYL